MCFVHFYLFIGLARPEIHCYTEVPPWLNEVIISSQTRQSLSDARCLLAQQCNTNTFIAYLQTARPPSPVTNCHKVQNPLPSSVCNYWTAALASVGILTEMQDGSRRPSCNLIFVNSDQSTVSPWWISRLLSNLRFLAQTVHKLWHFNRNPKWRPAAILNFWILLILIILPRSHGGSLGSFQIWGS